MAAGGGGGGSNYKRVSYIDGVPVKISERFRPPPKVTLPSMCHQRYYGLALQDEYNFSLERQVIQLAETRRKAREAAERARSERLAKTIEQFTRMAEAEREKAEARENAAAAVVPSLEERPTDDRELSETPPPPHNPSSYRMEDSILKPVLLPSSSSLDGSTHLPQMKPKLNLADFEAESSPFDNMELKTINDMEVLRNVLENAHLSGNSTSNQRQRSSAPPVSALSSSPNSMTSSLMNYPEMANSFATSSRGYQGNFHMQYHMPYQNYQMESHSSNPRNTLPSGLSHSMNYNPEYMFERAKNENPRSYQFRGSSIPPHMQAYAGAYQPPPPPYSPYPSVPNEVPPPVPPHASWNSAGYSGTSRPPPYSSILSAYVPNPAPQQRSVPVEPAAASNPVPYIPPQIPQPRPQPTQPEPVADNPVNEPVQTVAKPEPDGEISPSSMHPLRTSHSTPDLLKELGLVVSSSDQPPLPPEKERKKSPVPNLPQRPSSVGPGTSVHTTPEYSTAVLPHPRTRARAHDSYSELAPDMQALVRNISDMGFPRACVTRAMLKIGPDSKKIVEHLCLLQTLVERGYQPDMAEMALHLHDQDEAEAINFLELMAQFKGLGFDEDAIRKALIRCNNDRDKALDCLVSL